MARRPALRALAERAGILPGYVGADGSRHQTSDATREALLAALGLDAGDEAAARRSLASLQDAPEERVARELRCLSVGEVLGRRRTFGVWANLWSLRGPGLGVGNLSQLRELVRLAAESGADFVGIGPLHAIRNRVPETSPYSPSSRLFRNPLYLDPDAVPGAQAQACAGDPARVDYPASAERLRQALAGAPRGPAPGAGPLRDFATFQALEDEFGVADWRRWPRPFRDPRSREVAAFAAAHQEALAFHAGLQRELDAQLAAVAEEARRSGLAIGLYGDLALGSLASGFDAWAFPGLFLDGATLGAPPDPYAAEGQDWSLPPAHPHRLLASGYWRSLLDASLAHTGALRIDHVMGLFRQFWIPAGRPAREGAYVAFPSGPLLAELAQASRRHRSLVVGEDLGTLPPGLPARLARRAILSYRVLLFERDRRGAFRPAARWPRRALATATTHDLPTLAAWWRGSDVALRREHGLLGARDAARAERARVSERRALARRVGLRADATYPDLCRSVHSFLAATPCPLLAVSLDDLAGEVEPANLPGVSPDRYPSWTRRMGRTPSEIFADPLARDVLRALRRRARR